MRPRTPRRAPAALRAALACTGDHEPGYRRERDRHGGFRYRDRDGRLVRHPAVLARIRALAIPPAYEDVWICARADGHLQATGRDARGRKQYIYHPDWTARRGRHKFDQLAGFGAALVRIRRRVRRDLRLPGLPRERILALAVALLDGTLIRIGSARYARGNGSYGLTTLTRRHATVSGAKIRLRFRGKSGVDQDVTVVDRRLARLVRRCLDLPGQRLFKYHGERGAFHRIDSAAVNAYLREIAGRDVSAKHFRTWGGSVMALDLLSRAEDGDGDGGRPRERERRVNEAMKSVARRLGNTATVCRACYVHPAVVSAYLDGAIPARGPAPPGPRGLSAAERRLLAFLARDSGADAQRPHGRRLRSGGANGET
ncbi:DNA topoisomerase IB [Castellaniella defragrans]|uniref:DNA topoisomerase IB n=1 Tax=Castellaniella defragrans TaxID=75697 RepID=UPI0023F17C40|nr:DNA topoisomerase IB [Castellaniella defragrans]